MVQIIYPEESFFYPYHLVVALTTSVIFIVIIFSYRQFLRRKPKPKLKTSGELTTTSKLLNLTEFISLATLLLAIIGTGLFPTLLRPLLDYSVSQNNSGLEVVITNLGLAPTGGVIISVTADNVNFSDFESQPYLSNYFRSDGSIPGKGFSEVNTSLPPRSQLIVRSTMDLSDADKDEPLRAYVRSDLSVAYHDSIITSIFYLGLSAVYVGVFVYWVFWGQLTGSTTWRPLDQRGRREILGIFSIIVVGEILATLIYYWFNFPLIGDVLQS